MLIHRTGIKHTQAITCVCFFFTTFFKFQVSKSKSGFTLIELIIVIVIIAILGLGVNALIGDTTSTKAFGTARKIQSDIIFAQESAMSHAVHYRIQFTPTTGYNIKWCNYQITICSNPANWTNAMDFLTNTSPFMVTLNSGSYSGVTLTSTTLKCNYLEFNSAGNPFEDSNAGACATAPNPSSPALTTVSETVTINSGTRTVTILPATGKTSIP